jgi:hypothetical protein
MPSAYLRTFVYPSRSSADLTAVRARDVRAVRDDCRVLVGKQCCSPLADVIGNDVHRARQVLLHEVGARQRIDEDQTSCTHAAVVSRLERELADQRRLPLSW